MSSFQTLEMLERFLLDGARDFSAMTQNVRQGYGQRYATLRAVGASGFPIVAFVVATLLAYAAIASSFLPTALQVSSVAVALASLEFVVFFVISLVTRWRFGSIGTALTRMDLAYSYLVSAFRTEVVGLTVAGIQNPLDTATQNDLIRDYHYFHYVFDAAVRAWLLRVLGGRLSRGYLDTNLRRKYQEHVDDMADRRLSFWTVMERRSPRIELLLEGNEDVKREVESYSRQAPAMNKQ